MDRAIAARSSILELGCGTGRIADLLAKRGHRVVGVDSSAEMLSYLTHAVGVHGAIETLGLAERFDVVVVASHLVNSWDRQQAGQFLSVAHRHLVPGGQVVLQRHLPGRPLAATSFVLGEVRLSLVDVVDHGDAMYSATLRHEWNDVSAEQDFSTRILTDAEVQGLLGAAGFEGTRVLTKDRTWVVATRRIEP
ncbi:MAG: class I SAM-dependent methyltransferase [Ornithinimicrobium sp.]